MTTTKSTTKKLQDDAKRRVAVFIERESHLGYRAYRAEIVGEQVEKIEPLHNSPDLESIAISIAIQELEP